jgi:hypothetical protein
MPCPHQPPNGSYHSTSPRSNNNMKHFHRRNGAGEIPCNQSLSHLSLSSSIRHRRAAPSEKEKESASAVAPGPPWP